eukprot:CAMPEP_0202689844 /NCGR_PEP_ID=MMETSP1385-20130828/5033_1 /ASSEMBLY_ACC=CAM_ASM_000861 /TAXON_ID=933848 /ORGANISM="Elphidium margaritaceum" /LENGTH=311 /DNA_ID=CAMNT_0049345047 /DNA_START=44 /DNA_END=979 /DNA_ORIENTATION=+
MSSEKQSNFGFSSDELTNRVKLCVYDFDQTITCDHLFYELEGGRQDALHKMSEDDLLKVFGGNARKERLQKHFERVSQNCELAIISFGWSDVIKLALQRMDLHSYFDHTLIYGKDSEELKTAGSKAKCIYAMKKHRKLKSDQILFIDDDNSNLSKATIYSVTILISPRNGMQINHMQEIEEKVGVYPTNPLQMELTTPKTMTSQISKFYPSQKDEKQQPQNDEKQESKNELEKYKITTVPDWFAKLNGPAPDTPVIQIGGDQTPGSDSEYELNVPVLNIELENVVKTQEEQQAEPQISLQLQEVNGNGNDN